MYYLKRNNVMQSLKTLVLLAFLGCALLSCQQSDVPTTFTNPILPGSHPDPSICRVGDTYYIVNSSFIWYPGVPIHRSKDLVNWELIGYALNTPKHLNIGDRTGQHGGIWAPTIRYHEGLFYLTVTQKQCGTSILTTATNPEGPWSEPVTLHSQNGIDGSLLFDEEKAWYTWSEDHLILLREYDKEKMQLIGDTVLLLDEQMFGDDYSAIEGPHIYKLESGEYMLLIASGGTGSNNHNVSVFKSDKAVGPYKPCPNNPVLTHRGTDSPFNNIGHADIVETQNGEWYAVMLGVRPLKGLTIMDRETFMLKFEWKNGWPVFNADSNHMVMPVDVRPNLPWTPVETIPETDEFNGSELGLHYNFYKTPTSKWWSLDENSGHLRIKLLPISMTDETHLPVIARRITQFDYKASTTLNFSPNEGEAAGLVMMINHKGQIRLEVTKQNGKTVAQLKAYEKPRKQNDANIFVSDPVELGEAPYTLLVKANGLEHTFMVIDADGYIRKVGASLEEEVTGRIISRQVIGSYSGSYVGMFAAGNGSEANNYADFDNFTYSTNSLD